MPDNPPQNKAFSSAAVLLSISLYAQRHTIISDKNVCIAALCFALIASVKLSNNISMEILKNNYLGIFSRVFTQLLIRASKREFVL